MTSRLFRKMYVTMLNAFMILLIMDYSYLSLGDIPKNLEYAFILLFIISLIPNFHIYIASVAVSIQIIHTLIESIELPPQIRLMIYLSLYFNIISRMTVENS